MNNIQKSFKRKAEANGNCFAAGVVPSNQGGPVGAYTPTGGEAKMLAAFDERLGNALGTSTGGVTDPNAGLRKAGDMRLTQQTYDATNAIEDQRDQLGVAAQTDMTKRAGDQLDSIRRMSGLSNRQRATAAMGVAGDAAKMGVSLDTSSLTSGSGLSARQQLGVSGQQFDNQTAIGGYNTGLQSRALDRQKMGLAQGLDVNRKKLGMFADGKVPVHSGPGIVDGPGGPREDKVPAMLSDDEAVLPAKTVQALGGPDAVADLIEKTTGKAPAQGLRDGGRYYTGAIGDQIPAGEMRPEFRAQAQTPVIQPVPSEHLENYRNTRTAGQMAAMPEAPAAVEPAAPRAAAANPVASSKAHDLGLKAGKMYSDMGGAAGVAKKAVGGALEVGAKYVVPAAAAIDAVAGDGAIRVGTPEEASGGRKFDAQGLVDGGKQLALRAGDWGTRGVDALMDLPIAGLNAVGAKHNGKPLEHGVVNRTYREGMRNANIDGAVIPLSTTERELQAEAAKPEDQNADARAANAKILASAKNTPGSIDLPRIDKVGAKEAGNQARGLAVAKQFFPDGGMPEDIRVSRQNETNAPMAVWNSKGDAAAKTIGSLKDGSYIQPQDGTGIVSIRQKDGSFKNVALGKSEYLGADGKTTSDFSKTARYQQGLRDAAGQRQQLENFQRMNAESDMKSNDPNAQMNGLMTTMGLRATDAQRAAAAAKNAITPYQKWQMDVQASQEARANRQEAAANARNDRDFKAKDGKENRESYDRELEIMSGGDKAVHADLLRYASGYKDDPNAKGAENAQSKLAYVEARKWLNEKGQHALSIEKGDDGRSVPDFRKDSHRFWDYARGILGNEVYEDRRTGQRFSASTIDNAPEHVKKAFYDHLTMNAADRAAKQKAQ